MRQNLLIRETRCINKTSRTTFKIKFGKDLGQMPVLAVIREDNSVEEMSVDHFRKFSQEK